MKRFEFLGHTADLRIRATGKDVSELFANALKGMSEAMLPIKLESTTHKTKEADPVIRKIKVMSLDQSALLVDFLSHVLALSQANKEIFREVAIEELTDAEIKATIKGNKIAKFEKDVKAVTFFDAVIKPTSADPNKLEVTIVYDI